MAVLPVLTVGLLHVTPDDIIPVIVLFAVFFVILTVDMVIKNHWNKDKED